MCALWAVSVGLYLVDGLRHPHGCSQHVAGGGGGAGLAAENTASEDEARPWLASSLTAADFSGMSAAVLRVATADEVDGWLEVRELTRTNDWR